MNISNKSTNHLWEERRSFLHKFLSPKFFLPSMVAWILALTYIDIDTAEELHELKWTPIPTKWVVAKVYAVKSNIDHLLGIKK